MYKIEKNEKLISLGIGREEENSIVLSDIEYAYSVLNNLIKGNREEALKIKEKNEKVYFVYSFLFSRGYISRFTENSDFIRVGKKGYRRGEDRTYYLLRVVENIDIKEMLKDLEVAIGMRKKLVYAVVNDKIKFIEVENKIFV